MEENKTIDFVRVDEDPENPNSPFHGTPWNSDEEIYDFVIIKKYHENEDWEEIKYDLKIRGLDAHYADEIIANVRSEGQKAGKKIRFKAAGESILGFILLSKGFYHAFLSLDTTLTAKGAMVFFVGGGVLLIDGIRRLVKNYS